MASVALGIAAWGLMTSVSMIKSSLSLTEALLMGIFVVCRRLTQLAAVPLIAAGGVMGVLATAFCVNCACRFSAHLRPHRDASARVAAFVGRLFHPQTYSYVLFTKRYTPSADPVVVPLSAYSAGNSAINWFSWVRCSVVGVRWLMPPASTGARRVFWRCWAFCVTLVSTPLRAVSAGIASAAAVAALRCLCQHPGGHCAAVAVNA
jgi:predicted branched-subunit amino acid permease